VYCVNNCKINLQIDKTYHDNYPIHIQTQTYNPYCNNFKSCHNHKIYFLYRPTEEDIKKYAKKIENTILK
jgi:hypothetical protein